LLSQPDLRRLIGQSGAGASRDKAKAMNWNVINSGKRTSHRQLEGDYLILVADDDSWIRGETIWLKS